MDSYSQTVTVLIAAMCVPAWGLTVVLRPQGWKQLFRGGEVAICLAFAMDATRRLILIGTGVPVTYPMNTGVLPGWFWATFNITILTLIIMLLWGRIAQHIRHGQKNKDAARAGIQELEQLGIDTTEFRNKL